MTWASPLCQDPVTHQCPFYHLGPSVIANRTRIGLLRCDLFPASLSKVRQSEASTYLLPGRVVSSYNEVFKARGVTRYKPLCHELNI
jgi:hypothetical protein